MYTNACKYLSCAVFSRSSLCPQGTCTQYTTSHYYRHNLPLLEPAAESAELHVGPEPAGAKSAEQSRNLEYRHNLPLLETAGTKSAEPYTCGKRCITDYIPLLETAGAKSAEPHRVWKIPLWFTDTTHHCLKPQKLYLQKHIFGVWKIS